MFDKFPFDKFALDKVLGQLQRGTEQVRARGEAVTQTARLRLEIFGLSRELDALYGRLGRAYHGGADANVLGPISDEITRVDGEIGARERQIANLGERGEAAENALFDRPAEAVGPSPAKPAASESNSRGISHDEE